MSIGENIRRLRREREMTQEQLAEYLNLTPSAISQWETDRALPDVMQIPLLANLFRVSADVLFGIDVAQKDARIQDYYERARDLHCHGYMEESVAVCREGLREFPDAVELIEELANNLEYIDAVQYHGEMIALYEKLLDLAKGENTRNWATGNLIYLYKQEGRMDDAKRLADGVPVLLYTHERCQRMLLSGAERAENLRASIHNNLELLLYDIRNLTRQARGCTVDGKPFFTEDEQLEIWRKLRVFIETYYENGDYGFAEQLLVEIYYEEACIYLARGQIDATLDALERCCRHILSSDAYVDGLVGNHVEIPKEKQHISVLARIHSGAHPHWTVSSPTTENNANEYSRHLADARFDSIRDNERFVAVAETLRSHARADVHRDA